MAHNKRRVVQNIMEEKSLVLARELLPEEWVIHEYAPDYGVDFVVETFKFINEEKIIAETLGEFFFVQMKSAENLSFLKRKVYEKYNIEKSLKEDKSSYAMVDVISYPLEVNEINTIMSMGTSVPVVLLLADLSTEKIYFLCLTDYIEKIILPQNALNTHTSSITLYIPVENDLSYPEAITHLAFLARRSKLMGAFNKFNYQLSELRYGESEEMISRFISIVKSYDFWTAKPQWPALEVVYEELLNVEKFYLSPPEQRKNIVESDCFLKRCIEDFEDSDDFASTENSTKKKINDIYFKARTQQLWNRLCNLGNLYEEVCKEWFLPTYFWEEGAFGKKFDP